jgi:hypothetical protein
MKKTLSLIIAALILSTLILSSCKPQNKIDYSSDKSDLVITADGTTIFLTDTGEVYGLGRNVAYSLGLGHDNKVETAIKISIEEPIVKISAQEKKNSHLSFRTREARSSAPGKIFLWES